VAGLFLLNICNQNLSGATGRRTAKPEWHADCESTSGIEHADDIERKQFDWGAECHVGALGGPEPSGAFPQAVHDLTVSAEEHNALW
jgi:hypothetical protein